LAQAQQVLCFLRLRASVVTLFMALACAATSAHGGRRRWADVTDVDSDDEGASFSPPFALGGGAGREQATAFKAPATDAKIRGADIKSGDDRATASSGSVASIPSSPSVSSRCDDLKSDDGSTVVPMRDESRWFECESDDDLSAPQMASESCRPFGAPDEASIVAPTGSDGISSDDGGSTAPPMAIRNGAAGLQGHVGLSAPAMPSEVQLPTPQVRKGRGNRRQRKCRGGALRKTRDNGQRACGVEQPSSSTEGLTGVKTHSVLVERLPPKLCNDSFFQRHL